MFKELFGKAAEVSRNFRRLNCIVQRFAHHRQHIMKILWQVLFGPISFPSFAMGEE
jgi:hypothetical protein